MSTVKCTKCAIEAKPTDALVYRTVYSCKIIDDLHLQLVHITPLLCSTNLSKKYKKYNRLSRSEACQCFPGQASKPFDKSFTIYNNIQKILTNSIKKDFNNWHKQISLPLPKPDFDNYSSSGSDMEKIDVDAV